MKTAKEILTEMLRAGVPGEKLNQPNAAEVFVSLLPTITNEQAEAMLETATYDLCQRLLEYSASNLFTRLTAQEN